MWFLTFLNKLCYITPLELKSEPWTISVCTRSDWVSRVSRKAKSAVCRRSLSSLDWKSVRHSDSRNVTDIIPTIYLISVADASNSSRWCFLWSVVPVSWLVIITDSAHPAAVIEVLLIFSLLGIADYISLVLSHHDAIGTSATSSIVILAVLFSFTITGIAVFIILQPSVNLYWYFLYWVLQTIFHWCW